MPGRGCSHACRRGTGGCPPLWARSCGPDAYYVRVRQPERAARSVTDVTGFSGNTFRFSVRLQQADLFSNRYSVKSRKVFALPMIWA